MSQKAIIAKSPAHYQRFGITNEIQPFEDGLRTDPSISGTYEWWYFDAHLDNGAKIVTTFFTKSAENPKGGLAPKIQIDIDLPDGSKHSRLVAFDPSLFSASKDQCDVQIGDNSFVGDLHTYRIQATVEDLAVDIELTGQTEPWRPETGHILYGDDERGEFGWLPSVPYGTVNVTYRVGDQSTTTAGHGYHDHNWGNVALPTVVNNWYWGRGAVGEYTFITAYIVSEKKYDYTAIPIFMLAKDGKVIADNGENVTFEKSGITIDEITGKPVADVHSYAYDNENLRATLTYTRHETILRTKFADEMSGFMKLVLKLIGFDGSYLRFTGDVTINVTEHDAQPDQRKNTAIWELMYFGKNRKE